MAGIPIMPDEVSAGYCKKHCKKYFKHCKDGMQSDAGVLGGAEEKSGVKDSYTFSKKTLVIYFVVLFLLVVMASIGIVRHVKYMKKHCAPGVTGGGAVASYFTDFEY